MIKAIVLDFDGVFTDNTVLCGPNGDELVLCSRSDSLGISKVIEAGINVFVISTESAPVVGSRCTKMGINYRKGVKNKLQVLRDYLDKIGVDEHELIYVGNDVNDLPCLDLAGIGVTVPDAHPEVAKVADYVTTAPGGHGAVREICDKVLNGDFENVFGSNNTG